MYRAANAPDPLDFANALRPAALLKEQQGDRDAARQFWSEAHALYRVAGVEAGVEECARRIRILNSEF